MADERTFTEIIVSKLGAPKEPLGLEGVLVLCLLALAAAAYLALEYGLGRLVARFFGRGGARNQVGEERRLDE